VNHGVFMVVHVVHNCFTRPASRKRATYAHALLQTRVNAKVFYGSHAKRFITIMNIDTRVRGAVNVPQNACVVKRQTDNSVTQTRKRGAHANVAQRWRPRPERYAQRSPRKRVKVKCKRKCVGK